MPRRNCTPFIARRWTGKVQGLTAILPTIPAGDNSQHITTYDIPGQHGSGLAYYVMHNTAPATDEEAETLRAELERVGYFNPQRFYVVSQAMHRERREAFTAMMQAITDEATRPRQAHSPWRKNRKEAPA